MLPDSGTAPGSPNPPASSAGVNPRGSSNNASGLPPVSATIWSRTRASRGPVSTESSSARGIVLAQTLDHQLRQPRQLIARDAGREHQTDRLRLQAARHERQDLRRGAIEPLLVIHHTDQRPLLGHLREQAQDRQTDQKAIRRRPGTDTERGQQRITLRNRETLDAIQHRRQQLMQPGERQLHLRLDTGGAHHPAARRLRDQVLQQRRLAHTRFAAHHQRPALTAANRLDELVEDVPFAAPAPQFCGASSDRGMGGHHARHRRYTRIPTGDDVWPPADASVPFAIEDLGPPAPRPA